MEELLRQLSRQLSARRFGKFRGFVIDNADPEKRGRLKVRVPSVLGTQESDWALPCLPFGGLADQGLFLVPEVDAQVWVEFEEGDISRPIWCGTFWQASGDPPEEAAAPDAPTTRVLKTVSGHTLQFDDESGCEKFRLFHPAGAEISIDENGTVVMTDAAGSTLTLDAAAGKSVLQDSNNNTLTMDASGTLLEDASGNQVELAAAGITVRGQMITVEGTMVALGGSGGEPLIKGSTFLTLFATHIHPTGMGPSGPPIPQGEMSALSAKVTSA
jgi:uncharacterized protein involved in type VI secretion and phage assembly